MIRIKCLAICVLIVLITLFCSCSDNNNSLENAKSKAQYIKNISAASLYDPLEKKGFKVDKQIGGDAIFIDCDRTTPESNEHVRIAGNKPSEIVEIRASYSNYSKGKTNELAKPFLGFVATLPYENSNPEKAKKWVEENISKNSTTDINGVRFEIIGNNKNTRTLLIAPTK